MNPEISIAQVLPYKGKKKKRKEKRKKVKEGGKKEKKKREIDHLEILSRKNINLKCLLHKY